MNLQHAHLLLNHIPVVGLGFAAAFLLWGVLRKSSDVIRAALLSFVVVAIISVPVFFTGNAAEEIVEEIPGVSHGMIERHEDAGLVALIGLEVLGVAALVALVASRRKPLVSRTAATVCLVLAMVVGGVVGWAANLGGQIRHPEIGSSHAVASTEDKHEDHGGSGRR